MVVTIAAVLGVSVASFAAIGNAEKTMKTCTHIYFAILWSVSMLHNIF
jgi:hypothetical protein